MTKIDIFSGFLGAGKTTLIKKLIKEAYAGEKLVLIENEFGEIGIDGTFMQDAGIEVTEMNSGCICCSLVGDFGEALKKVLKEFAPDRILIEPSGVGKLSDVIKAVKGIDADDAYLNSLTTVVDAGKCKMYMKNFGEFFIDQVENAKAVIFSHADTAGEVKTENAISLVKEKNDDAIIISTPLDKISGKDILEAIEGTVTLSTEMEKLKEESHHHHGHHHDEECHCHDHHHDHHHHHADEVFTSWGKETSKKYDKEEIEKILNELSKEEYGMVLRAKGIVASDGDEWIHFDYVPGEPDVRFGCASVIGRICVIGSGINEEKLSELF